MMKIDMHVHSGYSYDSDMKIEHIAKIIRKRKLDGIALTDHNTFAGIKKAKDIFKRWGLTLIPGVEIRNNHIDYLVYFVEDEKILKLKYIFDIIDYVRENNGVIGIAHPYRKGYKLPKKEVIQKLDIIEVFNAKNRQVENTRATQLNKIYKKTATAGSDAHIYPYLGLAYTIFDDDLRICLLKNKVRFVGRYPSYLVKILDKYNTFQHISKEKKRYYIRHPIKAINKVLKR